jgi:transposase InsO family protein
MNKEEKFNQIALFRYSLIAPAIANVYEAPSLAQYFRYVASKKHKYIDESYINVTASTLERWFYNYKKSGLTGITPKERADVGRARAMPKSAMEQIYVYKEKYPYITGKAIYTKLIQEGYIKASETSLATIHRYLRNNNLKPCIMNENTVKAFEMEFANECWQADTSHGPVIKIDGKKVQTYLISYIDDASRMNMHSEFYINDNAINMQDAFKKAILKNGIPKKLFVDNGKSYDNIQLKLICASLGVVLAHARPFCGSSKGKIERMFRTVKDGWMNTVDWNTFLSLEDVNLSLNTFLSEKYTNQIHSSINSTPKDRFMRDYDKLRFLSVEELEIHFYHRRECRVSNAATIKMLGNVYETPQEYIGSKIKIRYLPTDLSKLFIFSSNNKIIHTIYPIKKIDNSKIKRTPINYSNSFKREE